MTNVKYYALFKRIWKPEKPTSTPKFAISKESGDYPPMEALRGKDGLTSIYLLSQINEDINAPAMRLQAKNSLNLTGLKDYFIDGKLSGLSYGYPPSGETYGGKKKRVNPFKEHGDDCFLFLMHTDTPDDLIPSSIEMLVVNGGKTISPQLVKRLQMGEFDDDLNYHRKNSHSILIKSSELPNFGKCMTE